MKVIETLADLRAQIAAWKAAGDQIGFVPTMGNLHEGHLSLVDLAKTKAQKVVVSLFVNPLQFGPDEDFDRYPRTFEQDRALLEARGADLVFVPSVTEMYPFGQRQTQVVVPDCLTGVLEGASRPGHFDGVTTVVNKLFQMVQPDLAVFGQKDYQQLKVIQRMVRDLAMPVDILAGPIFRDEDGLALSSRNQYLSAEQRLIAPKLCVCLQNIVTALTSGNQEVASLEKAAVLQLLDEGFDEVDYVKIVDAETLLPIQTLTVGMHCVILAVARLGKTRLLDNFLLTVD